MFNTDKVIDTCFMFGGCKRLEELDLSNFNMNKVRFCSGMFYACECLKRIKCNRAFKEWCIEKRDMIGLPFAMLDDNSWDLID